MKKLINLGAVLSLFLIMGFATTTNAQQKIAHVDADLIVPEMPEYKQAKSNVEAFGKVLQKDLEAKQVAVQKYYDDVMNKVQNGLVTPIQQKEYEQELQKMQEDLQKSAAEADGKLVQKEQELTKPLYEKFNSALEKVATTNGYSYIFDVKMALFSGNGIDATDQVKQVLGL